MANYNRLLSKNDFSDVWLMELPKGELPFTIDGVQLTAENMWNLSSDDREIIIEKLLDEIVGKTYIEGSFPTEKELNELIKKIKKLEPPYKNGYVSNTSTTGLDIIRRLHPEFYDVKDQNSKSINEIFSDRETLKKVLYNRCGAFTTTEEKIKGEPETERPYLFALNMKAIVKGIHSCRLGINTSQFRPSVAKWIYEKMESKKVLDLSCGWSSRYLAANALGIEYYGIDPMTADTIKKEISLLKDSNSNVICGCSENSGIYKQIPECDSAICCPPYYLLEIYPSNNQSTTNFPVYNDWLVNYWKLTIENMSSKVTKNFAFIMIDEFNGKKIANDMINIILSNGWILKETVPYKTTKSHLAGKKKTGTSSKDTEKIYFFER